MTAQIAKHHCRKITDVRPPLASAGNVVGFTIETTDGEYAGNMAYRFYDFPPEIAEAFYKAILEVSKIEVTE